MVQASPPNSVCRRGFDGKSIMRQDGIVLAITLCPSLKPTITFVTCDGSVKSHRDLGGGGAAAYACRTCGALDLAPCLSSPGPLGSGRSLGHTRERPVKTGAEGATAPETLRQKDRVRSPTLESRGKPLTEGAKSMCRSDMGEISQVLRQRGQAWLLPGLAQPCRNREIEWQRRLRRFSAPPSTIFM
jgi:hypothetical protein